MFPSNQVTFVKIQFLLLRIFYANLELILIILEEIFETAAHVAEATS